MQGLLLIAPAQHADTGIGIPALNFSTDTS